MFDHGNVITAEDVELARGLGVEVVPSVNVFHYSRCAISASAVSISSYLVLLR